MTPWTLRGRSLLVSFMKTRNKVGLKIPPVNSCQRLLVAVSSIYMDSDLPIYQILKVPLALTSCCTRFLEFRAEPISPDLLVCLFHVYPHHQNMLFILKAILDPLGSVGHLVFSGTLLPRTCLFWSDDVIQVPYQAGVDHSRHDFANTTGESDGMVAVCSLGPCQNYGWVPCQVLCSSEEHALSSPLLLKIPGSLVFALVPRCFSFSLVILLEPGDFLFFKILRACSNSFVLIGHIFRWLLITLVGLFVVLFSISEIVTLDLILKWILPLFHVCVNVCVCAHVYDCVCGYV